MYIVEINVSMNRNDEEVVTIFENGDKLSLKFLKQLLKGHSI